VIAVISQKVFQHDPVPRAVRAGALTDVWLPSTANEQWQLGHTARWYPTRRGPSILFDHVPAGERGREPPARPDRRPSPPLFEGDLAPVDRWVTGAAGLSMMETCNACKQGLSRDARRAPLAAMSARVEPLSRRTHVNVAHRPPRLEPPRARCHREIRCHHEALCHASPCQQGKQIPVSRSGRFPLSPLHHPVVRVPGNDEPGGSDDGSTWECRGF
jgi:hypothetical protein